MITTLEEISLNALPALQTYLLDGWVLRFANGYTRRANSVNPLYPSRQTLADKIEQCEQIYQAHNLSTVFKITPASQPLELDATLEARGYRADAPTSVQMCALTPNAIAEVEGMTIFERVNDEWFEAYARMGGLATEHHDTMRRMLELIVPQTALALLKENGQTMACGLGVLDQNAIGLYDIVVDPSARRRGHGTQLIQQILAWSTQRGANLAYLQVMLSNAPALALYAQLGFVEHHRYWYRVRG